MYSNYVNLAKYPLEHRDSKEYKEVIEQAREMLTETNIVILEDFITAEGVDHFNKEIEARLSESYHRSTLVNPYHGTTGSNEFSDDHPRNTFGKMERFGLARHQLLGTVMDEHYNWLPLRKFIADINGFKQAYLSADPSNALVVQIYRDGCGQAWHFDEAQYTTIINLGEADAGGVFECVPNLRTTDDENFDEVRKVLHDQSDRVQQYNVKSRIFGYAIRALYLAPSI